MAQNFGSAVAERTVEEVIDSKEFGNLAKLVPLSILAVGIAASVLVAVIRGLDYEVLLQAGITLVTFGVAGGVGSVAAWKGKSQTQLDLQAARSANTVPVATETGTSVGALPAESALVHGNYKANIEQEPPAAVVSDPEFAEPAVLVDEAALDGEETE